MRLDVLRALQRTPEVLRRPGLLKKVAAVDLGCSAYSMADRILHASPALYGSSERRFDEADVATDQRCPPVRAQRKAAIVEQESPHSRPPRVVQCGVYEINLEAGELRKNGLKVRLQEQPFNILAKLLARPGQLVTREELQEQLWGPRFVVDPELGLNTAIKKLRAAFGDQADNPRFIETIPKRGYRFLTPVRAREGNGLRDGLAMPAPPLQGALYEPLKPVRPGDRPEAVGSRISPDENILRPEPALPGEKAGRADEAIRRLALFAAAFRANGGISRRCRAAILILVLACAGILTGQIPYISFGYFTPNTGVSVYRAGRTPDHRGVGIGGYDLRSRSDQAFAFDYDHSGRQDYLALYRPGTGGILFVKNSGGTFISVYGGDGLGQYDLKSAADRVIAFDYDHSGRQDHLALYRLDAGIVAILRNDGDGIFTPVYERSTGDPGAVTRDAPAEQVFGFDYDHSGKLDHLVLYRPGTGTLEIFTNAGGTFAPVCAQGAAPESTCVYDLKRPDSQVLAFDYDHNGKLDHLVFYRPGAGTIAILKNLQGTFVPVYDGQGIGGYDLKSASDRALAFDYDHSGRPDHLLLYRPGAGIVSILKNTGGTFSPAYERHGIAGYDLLSPGDRAFAFDYDHTGKLDYLVLYRPGPGFVQIARLR
jgi:DNA-binding winged helix-turn-helix (wHTH) protein